MPQKPQMPNFALPHSTPEEKVIQVETMPDFFGSIFFALFFAMIKV
jgi:hypothetical protein